MPLWHHERQSQNTHIITDLLQYQIDITLLRLWHTPCIIHEQCLEI
jgi:hypothetical protein